MDETVQNTAKNLDYYFQLIVDKVILYGPKVLLGLFILWIGLRLIRKVPGLLDGILKKAGFSDSLRPFLTSIVSVVLKVVLLLIVAGIIGINLSVFATIIAASVFAVGMALQGSLGNFASGLIVLSMKPYEVNDWIRVQDKFGKVEEIGVFNTIVITPGRKTLIIPNGMITGDVVTNYSKKGLIRLELKVAMPYSEDFPKVKAIIREALQPIDKILKEPVTEIGIVNFDSHSIELAVLPYTHPDNFWEVTYDSYSRIKKAFSENGIQVAYSEGVEMGSIGK